jgi:hypothetical protein
MTQTFKSRNKKKDVILELKEYKELAEESFSDSKESFASINKNLFFSNDANSLYIAKENNFNLNIEKIDKKTRKSSI